MRLFLFAPQAGPSDVNFPACFLEAKCLQQECRAKVAMVQEYLLFLRHLNLVVQPTNRQRRSSGLLTVRSTMKIRYEAAIINQSVS